MVSTITLGAQLIPIKKHSDKLRENLAAIITKNYVKISKVMSYCQPQYAMNVIEKDI